MALPEITQVVGSAVPVPGTDIDTDRIIPARFMKCVTFDDLAEGMFYDVKVNPETGEKTNHPLNDTRFEGASIILSGANFGCGSSREHAPQAIYRSGFRAIIAESFAEIFFGNSTTLGMPCVCAAPKDIASLTQLIDQAPETRITIDLETQKVHYADISFPITMPDSAKSALTKAKYDPLAELLESGDAISKKAVELGYVA
jgi:3-isopropylmalate/(R)-2-methylmalate dehydratase small subunit